MTKNEIPVTVTVVNGKPVPSQDPINVTAGKSNVKIIWSIAEASRQQGYTFAKNSGIVVNANVGQFEKSKQLDEHRWEVVDKNNDAKHYSYTINVVDRKGNTYTHDPSIRNGQQ
jgi:hypothetical protein